jgi:hypothetical protein
VSANNSLLWHFQSHMFMVRAIEELPPDAAQVLAPPCQEYSKDRVECHRRDQLFVARYGGGGVGDLEGQFLKTSLPPIPSVLAKIFPILSRGVLESLRNIFLRMAGDSAMVAWKRLEIFWWTKRSLTGRWTRMFSRSSVV